MKKSALILFALIELAASCAPPSNDRALPLEEFAIVGTDDTYELRQTGQPRALNLWATWCAPCRAELPDFDDVASRVEGVEIVGINVGETGDQASGLIEELGLSFLQVLDPQATMQTSLRITGMPATIFVDEAGEVVQVHSGELNIEELETVLVDLFDATFSTPSSSDT